MNIFQQIPVNKNKVFLFFRKNSTTSLIYRKIFSGFSGYRAIFSVLMVVLLVGKVVLQIRTVVYVKNDKKYMKVKGSPFKILNHGFKKRKYFKGNIEIGESEEFFCETVN